MDEKKQAVKAIEALLEEVQRLISSHPDSKIKLAEKVMGVNRNTLWRQVSGNPEQILSSNGKMSLPNLNFIIALAYHVTRGMDAIEAISVMDELYRLHKDANSKVNRYVSFSKGETTEEMPVVRAQRPEPIQSVSTEETKPKEAPFEEVKETEPLRPLPPKLRRFMPPNRPKVGTILRG